MVERRTEPGWPDGASRPQEPSSAATVVQGQGLVAWTRGQKKTEEGSRISRTVDSLEGVM